LKFKGSKGVATYIGALSSIQILQLPLLGLVACGTWLATALVFRIASLASLMMMLVTTAFALMTGFGIPVAFMSFLVLYSHKDNIKRLFNGTEPKIWQKKEESQP
jgi:glycerol-3-phosphate acyltransferase PlsY